jgi:hypothetical protein
MLTPRTGRLAISNHISTDSDVATTRKGERIAVTGPSHFMFLSSITPPLALIPNPTFFSLFVSGVEKNQDRTQRIKSSSLIYTHT